MSKIRILWKDIPRKDWEKTCEQLPKCNLYQDWDYGDAACKAIKVKPHRGLIYRNQKIIGLVQGFEKKYLFGLKLVRFIRGPLFTDAATPAERLRCYTGIKKSCRLLKRQLATIIPELSYSDGSEKSLKEANLSRILAGDETSWIDLRKPEKILWDNLSKNWQRDIKQAEKKDLAIKFDCQLEDILALQKSDKSRKNYFADEEAIYRYLPAEKLVIVETTLDSKVLSSALFIKHGNSATYQIGWSLESARNTNAQKLLLWHSILHLKNLGIHWLDLGAMDSKSAPGITKFKSGLGGESFIFSGTYI